ncbi:hypothetical protein [Acidovorax sp. M2(2025)]|uniref:hypothetical protein n=1 Tax=Acidovorax sp. M2(2025) TaxID=3411355 RepID=UPI003BF59CBA
MFFYAQVDSARRAFAVTQAASELEGPDLVPLDAYDLGVLGKVHNADTGEWDESPALAAQSKVSVLAFRRRFTIQERAGIEWAAVDRADQPDAQRQQAALLRATLADQAAASFIDLADATTVEGVQGMEAMGLIAPGRAAEILGASVQPEELP